MPGLEDAIRKAMEERCIPDIHESEPRLIAAAVLDYAKVEMEKIRPPLAPDGNDPYNDGFADGLEQLEVALGGGDV